MAAGDTVPHIIVFPLQKISQEIAQNLNSEWGVRRCIPSDETQKEDELTLIGEDLPSKETAPLPEALVQEALSVTRNVEAEKNLDSSGEDRMDGVSAGNNGSNNGDDGRRDRGDRRGRGDRRERDRERDRDRNRDRERERREDRDRPREDRDGSAGNNSVSNENQNQQTQVHNYQSSLF
uniref:Uncharacterized protein n=2 Tax=Timema TaxID=61471 RepID=A0A7R9ISR3_9NEOP|nr:unnamed protein product [Timema tahoe]